MAELAARWAPDRDMNPLETGGSLFGSLTHGGRIVVSLATPPGPKAVHESTHFQDDLDQFKRTESVLNTAFAIQPVGMEHSHHYLIGFTEPSSGDIQTTRSITRKNHIKTWIDLISTCESPTENGKYHSGYNEPHHFRCRSPLPFVRIHAYYYSDAPAGEKTTCQIRVLPGISPIRQLLICNGLLTEDEFGAQDFHFPMNRILFDAYEPNAAREEPAIPEELLKQIRELPESVLEKLEISPRPPFFIVTLPVQNGSKVRIAFNEEILQIQFVYLDDPARKEQENITDRLIGSSEEVSLANLFARIRVFVSTRFQKEPKPAYCHNNVGYAIVDQLAHFVKPTKQTRPATERIVPITRKEH